MELYFLRKWSYISFRNGVIFLSEMELYFLRKWSYISFRNGVKFLRKWREKRLFDFFEVMHDLGSYGDSIGDGEEPEQDVVGLRPFVCHN